MLARNARVVNALLEDKTFALNSISGQARRLLCELEPVGVDLVFGHSHSQAIQIRERASPTRGYTPPSLKVQQALGGGQHKLTNGKGSFAV